MISYPDKLQSKNIILRKTNIDDSNNIVMWRNKDYVRKNLMDSSIISFEKHIQWFTNNVSSGKVRHFIINYMDQKDIGVIFLKNIDLKEKSAEIGLFIGEESYLNKSLGTEALQLLIKHYFIKDKILSVYLNVKKTNKSAIKSYFKNHFVIIKEFTLKNENYLKMIVKKNSCL